MCAFFKKKISNGTVVGETISHMVVKCYFICNWTCNFKCGNLLDIFNIDVALQVLSWRALAEQKVWKLKVTGN